jgi:hypothetical protein
VADHRARRSWCVGHSPLRCDDVWPTVGCESRCVQDRQTICCLALATTTTTPPTATHSHWWGRFVACTRAVMSVLPDACGMNYYYLTPTQARSSGPAVIFFSRVPRGVCIFALQRKKQTKNTHIRGCLRWHLRRRAYVHCYSSPVLMFCLRRHGEIDRSTKCFWRHLHHQVRGEPRVVRLTRPCARSPCRVCVRGLCELCDGRCVRGGPMQ